MRPVTDPYDSAYAIGGNGGEGMADDLVGESGGQWRQRERDGSDDRDLRLGRSGRYSCRRRIFAGGYGIAGEAYAVANAAAAGGGNAEYHGVRDGGPLQWSLPVIEQRLCNVDRRDRKRRDGRCAVSRHPGKQLRRGTGLFQCEDQFCRRERRSSALGTNLGSFYGPLRGGYDQCDRAGRLRSGFRQPWPDGLCALDRSSR